MVECRHGQGFDSGIRCATGVAILVCGLLAGCGNDGGDGAGGSDAAAAGRTVAGDAVLDPTPYRAEIEAVEARLYRQESPGWDEFERVGDTLTKLGSALLRRGRDRGARGAGQELLMLGSEVAARGDVGYATPDLPALRRRWEAVRNEHFAPAPWFRGNAVGVATAGRSVLNTALDVAQTPAGPPPVPAAELRAVESSLHCLDRLRREGRRECEELGEPTWSLEVRSRAADRHVARWNAWAREWEQRVGDCWPHGVSASGFDDDSHFLQAWQELENAAFALRKIPIGPGSWPVPFRANWEQDFAQTERHIAAAWRELGEARSE